MVITADPKLNNYLFQQEGKKVERWYLDTFQKVFRLEGEARPNAGGRIHKYVRGSFLNLFGVDSLRTNLLSEIETTIRTNIHRWSTQGTIDAKKEAAYVCDNERRSATVVASDDRRSTTMVASSLQCSGRDFVCVVQGYAVMFLKNNTSLVLLGLAEAPATPDRVSDLGIQEMSWKDHLTEENLFYVVSPGAMETYRNSIESHLAKVEGKRKTGSCIQEEVETSMYDAAADFVSQGGAYEEDEGETSTYYLPGGFEGNTPSKFGQKKRKNLTKSNEARAYDLGTNSPIMQCMENKVGTQQSMFDHFCVVFGLGFTVAVFAAKNLFGQDFEKSSDVTTDTIAGFVQGLMSFPLNIPGTRFYKCMKDKDKLEKVIRAMLKERIACPEEKKGDVLDHEVKDLNTDFFLSISTAITLSFKLFAKHPWVVEDLVVEHDILLKNRENKEFPLTWDEYKSMTVTMHVMNEVLRLGNVSPGILRRTLKDFNYNGYTIPAGWAIMIITCTLQLNPKVFKDPLAFNPRRWKDIDPQTASKNFMPFGGGIRQCAGAEFSKAFFAAFLHVLVSEYNVDEN
ncbi:unnamed protein product [Camellia sinensis]